VYRTHEVVRLNVAPLIETLPDPPLPKICSGWKLTDLAASALAQKEKVTVCPAKVRTSSTRCSTTSNVDPEPATLRAILKKY